MCPLLGNILLRLDQEHVLLDLRRITSALNPRKPLIAINVYILLSRLLNGIAKFALGSSD